jgi:hypothetical protein
VDINTLFSQPKCMLWVDTQGNLLSNLKLSFYEFPKEQGFFGKMFSDGNDKTIRDSLVRAY